MSSAFLVSKGLLCLYYKQNNTFLLVDMEFLFLTRRGIPYLQATMYYFVYHVNTIALYWEEKPTSLMNENK